MSDYRFGAEDYRLNYRPHEVMDKDGYIDWGKVEAVEIDRVDFIRKPDDKSRWHELFGTPERAAQTMALQCFGATQEACDTCVFGECDGKLRNSGAYPTVYDALLEWLRGDAE